MTFATHDTTGGNLYYNGNSAKEAIYFVARKSFDKTARGCCRRWFRRQYFYNYP